MSVILGKEFSTTFSDKQFVKLTNESEIHNGFEFKTGLNIDTQLFYPKTNYIGGGIYFCDINDIAIWQGSGWNMAHYCRNVILPDDAQIFIEYDEINKCDKYKTNKLILGEKQLIRTLNVWNDEAYCLNAINKNMASFIYIKNQTSQICMVAVKHCPEVIQLINNQTSELCFEAIKQNPYLLKYVDKQTYDLQLLAVKNGGLSLEHVNFIRDPQKYKVSKDKYNEICLTAIKQNSCALEYVLNPTNEMYLAAVKQNGLSIRFIKNKLSMTSEICLEAVKQNSNALGYITGYNWCVCSNYLDRKN
jgi:hypothetical protein